MPSSDNEFGSSFNAVEETNNKTKRPGIKPKEMASVYSDWAKDYDQNMISAQYNGPHIAAEEVAAHFSSERRPMVKVMDVAAGTGKVGQELYQRGFRKMDALDPSEGMMDVLQGTGVYGKTYTEFIGLEQQNTVPDGYYDVVMMVGAIGEGHIPLAGLDDIIRMTKPGGLVVILGRKEFVEEVPEYKEQLDPYMDKLEKQKKWQKIDRKEVDDFAFGKTGLVWTFKVL